MTTEWRSGGYAGLGCGVVVGPSGVGQDLAADVGPEGTGQVVTHPVVTDELGAADVADEREAPAGADQRVGQAVDDQGRQLQAMQRLGAVGLGDRGGELAGVAGAVGRAVIGQAGLGSQVLLVQREPGRTDLAVGGDGGVQRFLAVAGSGSAGHVPEHLAARLAHASRPGGGHHQGQAEEPFGGPQDRGLGDEAAHGHAEDVGGPEVEGIEEADGVVGHVGDRVRRVLAAQGEAAHLGDGRRRQAIEVGGAPDVAVVVTDDVVAVGGQVPAQVLGPGDHLGAEAHDQQQRHVGRVTEGLVRDLDVVADPDALFAVEQRRGVHGPQPPNPAPHPPTFDANRGEDFWVRAKRARGIGRGQSLRSPLARG